ncbi:murein hydrolase activator EnvC family protein [Bacteroidota bacterium]
MLKIIIIVIIVCVNNAVGQTVAELEKEKVKRLESIDLANILYQDARKDTQASLNKLNLINRKIQLRKGVIKDVDMQVKTIEREMRKNEQQIINLREELKDIKEEYAKMIYYAFKNRKSYGKLMFILSAKNFNMAFKRIKYIEQYSKSRKKQANKILITTEKIKNKIVELDENKYKNESLGIEKRNEVVLLSDEYEDQNELIDKLKNKEIILREDLAKKRLIYDALEKEIEKIVNNSGEKNNDKNSENNGKYNLTPEEEIVSSNFVKNYGKLPWPTKRGVVVEGFGVHQHPALRKVQIENKGIDISTIEGSDVRAIFDGEVKKVFAIPGANAAVIISHGEYLSVYQNLKNVIPSEGDKIKRLQKIGIVFTNKDLEKNSILHFEIWKGTKYIDPLPWLTKFSRGN